MSKAQDKRSEFRKEYDKVLQKAKNLGNFAIVRAKDMRSGHTMLETSYSHIQTMKGQAQQILDDLESVSLLFEETIWEKQREANFEAKPE